MAENFNPVEGGISFKCICGKNLFVALDHVVICKCGEKYLYMQTDLKGDNLALFQYIGYSPSEFLQ
jgi:hypothetical protein